MMGDGHRSQPGGGRDVLTGDSRVEMNDVWASHEGLFSYQMPGSNRYPLVCTGKT
eukprot:COSAG02_NODE_978_length_15497_cov_11.288349_8_plen_55_part_00